MKHGACSSEVRACIIKDLLLSKKGERLPNKNVTWENIKTHFNFGMSRSNCRLNGHIHFTVIQITQKFKKMKEGLKDFLFIKGAAQLVPYTYHITLKSRVSNPGPVGQI